MSYSTQNARSILCNVRNDSSTEGTSTLETVNLTSIIKFHNKIQRISGTVSTIDVKLLEIIQMTEIVLKRLPIAENGWERLECLGIAGNGWKWL